METIQGVRIKNGTATLRAMLLHLALSFAVSSGWHCFYSRVKFGIIDSLSSSKVDLDEQEELMKKTMGFSGFQSTKVCNNSSVQTIRCHVRYECIV